jgi:hypothetical protein
MFNIKGQKWRSDIDIHILVDPTKWLLKTRWEREPRQWSDLITKWSKREREGWIDLEPILLVNLWLAK